MLPMPLASAVQLILNQYDVYDVDTLLVMLRSPLDIAQIADLIDNSRELIDATAHTAHVSVQTETATAKVGTTMDSIVNVREVSSLATFSSTTHARMVQCAVQCSPSQPQMVPRAVQVTPARVATRNAASGTFSWHEVEQNAMKEMCANAHEEVLEEFEPALRSNAQSWPRRCRLRAQQQSSKRLASSRKQYAQAWRAKQERQQRPQQTGEQQRRTERWPPETVLIKKE